MHLAKQVNVPIISCCRECATRTENKRQLRYTKRIAYVKRIVLQNCSSHLQKVFYKGHVPIKKEDYSIRYVEEACADIAEKVAFYGTDNDLVTITSTVGFILERFKYHLKLHNGD